MLRRGIPVLMRQHRQLNADTIQMQAAMNIIGFTMPDIVSVMEGAANRNTNVTTQNVKNAECLSKGMSGND